MKTPLTVDRDRSRDNIVVSDAEGSVAFLVPFDEVIEDDESRARADAFSLASAYNFIASGSV